MSIKTWKGKILLFPILCVLVVLTLLLGMRLKNVDLLTMFGNEEKSSAVNVVSNNYTEENIIDIKGTNNPKFRMDEEVNNNLSEENTEDEAYATSHKKEALTLTEEVIQLSDVYAASSCDVHLRSYYPDAESYKWEKYNMQMKRWEELQAENIVDELYRNVSSVNIQSPENKGEYIMVRCTTDFADNRESITEIASVYSLGDKNNIAGISVSDEEYIINACEWVSIYDIPVNVVFADGTVESIVGLYGLAFIEKQEKSEVVYNDAGNAVEILTVTNTENKYSYIGVEEKETALRYRIDNDKTYETNIRLTGKDILPPSILSVNISEFDVINVDKPVTVTVSIKAEDNTTPYPFLEYAFLPEGVEPAENDWKSEYSFEKDINQNGIWTAYCKDQSGNISTFEKNIIAVDQKPPVMKVSLLNDSGWCKSNRIIVEAQDALPIEYFYSCYETGEESGWIKTNEYNVTQNSTWKVQARDAVGNITAKDITVGNVDKQMPVIKGISETKQKENNHNEEK